MMEVAAWQSDGDPVETACDMVGDEAAEHSLQRRPLPFTRHARRRGARRNIAPDAVDYVVAYGRMIQRTGVTFYFLGWRDIPPDDRRASWATRLEGTIVLVASDGEIITVYRNRRGLHTIRRKMKYCLPDLRPYWEGDADLCPVAAQRESA